MVRKMPTQVESLAVREYGLRMRSLLLRTMAAVLRAGADDPQDLDMLGDLEDVERELATLPPGLPMSALARRLGWNAIETDFMWATIGLATDPRLLVHARALDPTAPQGMSPALYSRIARLDAVGSLAVGRAFQPDGSLPRSGLLLPAPGTWLPTSTPWSPVPELLPLLLDDHPGDHLPVGVTRICRPDPIVLDEEQRAALDLLYSTFATPEILLVIQGPEGSGRRSAIAQVTERPVLALDCSRIDGTVSGFDHTLVSLFREASLSDAIAVIVAPEELVGEGADGRQRSLARRIDQSPVPVVVVTTREGFEIRSSRPIVRIPWSVPDAAARFALWRDAAGDFDASARAALAERYRIGAGAISRATSSARAISGKRLSDPLTMAEIVVGLHHNIAERMTGLAQRVVVKQTWADCVLPEDVETQITALIGRAQQAHVVYEQWGYRSKMPRGTGVAAMFSGPPGTGKTMVAGLIAGQLGLELYQVDLSQIVSKWIGETEKQLAKLFEAAEDGHAVLLFDEADSLFGKRSSEMRSATDRYANLEVNFLLQRIETFHGIAILTTNLDASIDPAFKRRLAAHVVFQSPDELERTQLWRRMVTADAAPLARDIDERALARQFPKMTGANIRNAALAAAFLAAARRREIDQETLLAAARGEYLSMGYVLATGSL
jgi:hypothetical protein